MTPRLRRVRRVLSWHRRGLAALLAAAAALSVLAAARPPEPPTVSVLVATHDLDGGAAMTADDVRRSDVPSDAAPEGVLDPDIPVDGRVLAGPVREGEPLTDVRLVGPSLLGAYADGGLVGAPVRLADARAAALLSPGDRVDVLAAPSSDMGLTDPQDPGDARVVASGVRVVTVPQAAGDAGPLSGATGDGALVVLATTSHEAAALAAAEAQARLSVVLRDG